jgi:hypothetical protein
MPCCALLLSLFAQPLLAVPKVRALLLGRFGVAACCQGATLAARGRALAPFVAVELLLLAIGTTGAAAMIAQAPLLHVPICSVLGH